MIQSFIQTHCKELIPVDNFGTVVGENPTPYGILALWAVNSLSIVYWDVKVSECDGLIDYANCIYRISM